MEQNAMKTVTLFLNEFGRFVVGVLSCFDQVRYTGHLAISSGTALEGFVDDVVRSRRCEFMALAEEHF
jgi:hypothetical protein